MTSTTEISSVLENPYICRRISSTPDMLTPIRKYNFWDENPIDLGYPRTFYTDKIGQYIDNKLIKVLVGQRRAGKSYILRQIASQLIANGTRPNNICLLYTSRCV